MASAAKIFGIPRSELLGNIGTALLQVKNARGLTAEDMRIVLGLKGDDMIGKYISGEYAMDVTAWLRANEAWPELAERVEETAAERSARSRQRPLDLDMPTRRSAA